MRPTAMAIRRRGRFVRATALATVAAALLLHPSILTAALSLDQVLASMDEAAAGWEGMRAKVRWERYLSLVDDTSVETGRIAVRREKSGDIAMLLEFEEPAPYTLSVRGAKVERYKPRIKTVEEYNLSKSRDKLENALLIGFGTAGSYLAKHYEITLAGVEAVAGHDALKLELEPREPEGELNNHRLEMWISTTYWQPAQIKNFERNRKDFRLYSYSDVETNPKFTSDEFKLRLARGTKRVFPQR